MILITGQSRSGTSLMFMVFALNGANTGYSIKGIDWLRSKLITPDGQWWKYYAYGRKSNGKLYSFRGGGEFFSDYSNKAKRGEFPDVIKHPYGPTNKNPILRLNGYGLKPDHVIITKRDEESIICSQADMMIRRGKWNLNNKEAENKIRNQVLNRYKELDSTFPNAIWVEFPKFIHDFDYLWGKIGHLLNKDNYEYTRREFEIIVNPKFVRF